MAEYKPKIKAPIPSRCGSDHKPIFAILDL